MAWQTRFDDFSHYNSNNDTTSNNSNPSKRQWGKRSSDFIQTKSSNSKSNYIKICDLTNESTHNIIGVIISKEGPRSFVSKKGSGSERNLISFTIRDEPSAFINLTCWGSNEFTTRLSDNFRIGDAIEIKNVQIQSKSKNPSDEKFKPWTPSPFCLNLSENHGEFNFYHGPEAEFLSSLLNIPTRESNDFYTLEDIQANGTNLQYEHINIFALVKKVWPLREIKTKVGKKTVKVDVVLCDETCPSFNLTLWDSYASLTEFWKPFETVVFVVDVKVSHSDYHSCMVACTDSKTLFTVDPDTSEAQALREFGISQCPNPLDMEGGQVTMEGMRDPELASITNIMTVNEAKTMHEDLNSTGQNGFGVVYGFLSQFDIDTENKNIARHICIKCRKSVVHTPDLKCSTPGCNSQPMLEYNISISLTDATGSLETCYVASSAMEQFINLPVSDFQNLTECEKTQLKWRYLFERAKAVIKFSGSLSSKSGKRFVKVMSLEKASSADVIKNCYASLSTEF